MPAALLPSLMYGLVMQYRATPIDAIGDADDTVQVQALDGDLLKGVVNMLSAVPEESHDFITREKVLSGLLLYGRVRVRIMSWSDDQPLRAPEFTLSLRLARERMARLETAWNGNVTIQVEGPKEDGLDVVFQVTGLDVPASLPPPRPIPLPSWHCPEMM